MKSVRVLGCSVLMALACGGPSAGGPEPEIESPDGEWEPESTRPSPDAASKPTSSPDAAALPSPDTGPVVAADAGAASDASPMLPPEEGTESYTCTRIIGINATAEWYNRGFEQLVDNAKWELVRVHSGFVEIWANPTASVWNGQPTSACAGGAKPDRIIYVALNFQYNTLEQWLPPLTAVVKNLQAKFPGVKRIELATFVRAPMNKPCPQNNAYRSTISAAQDQANEMVAAANPTLVRVSPRFEALTCSEYSGNPPHPSASGGMAWAKRIAMHYGLGK